MARSKRSSYRKSSTRRKSSAPKKSRRRRRVGAMALNASSPMVKYGAIAAGYFLGPKINEQITKLIGDKIDAKIVGIGEAGIGAMLAMKKGRKSMIEIVAGGALLGAGIKQLMTSFGIGGIGPYGRVPVIGAAGPYGRMPVLGSRGYSPNHSMNGYTPSGTMGRGNRVMAGVNTSGGSGYNNGSAGSGYMN